MRIRDTADGEEPPINMTSMMDMVFNLLIFFLVATTMAQEEREMAVKLPKTSIVRPLSAPPQQLIINIRQDGAMVVSGQAYPVAEIEQMVRKLAKEQPDAKVLVRADELSIHRYFAGVARMCHEAGINELKIGYLWEQPN